MEKTMMLPAMYNVLSQEEMTYTEGGATMTQALLAGLRFLYHTDKLGSVMLGIFCNGFQHF